MARRLKSEQQAPNYVTSIIVKNKCNHIIENYKFQYFCIKCNEFLRNS